MAEDAGGPDQQSGEATTDAPDRADAATSPQAGDTGRLLRAELAALVAGVIGLLVLCGLVGWLAWQAHESHDARVQRQLFVEAARQGAENLTTIDYEHAEADVQRVLDGATGAFHDNFARQSELFITTAKQTQSKSVGTVTGAGLESETGDRAEVLVVMTVQASSVTLGEVEPMHRRMRIIVQQTDDGMKVADVVGVP